MRSSKPKQNPEGHSRDRHVQARSLRRIAAEHNDDLKVSDRNDHGVGENYSCSAPEVVAFLSQLNQSLKC